ncbi:hypothetical protein BVC93_08110 [Mycobacterium sp. MS1601]|uniref:DUF732 domain-containing protein n=1 Tax=Mycobacterium sp. MS1601 TaxID=1936029 RepID=UPI0009795F81|nr:DUF732 domain-containing protein [Mycobacterium sp. MS1601]AQA02405.1 hypothetical protein BVC93_08110 [Mycobacterium sp. MS1601]
MFSRLTTASAIVAAALGSTLALSTGTATASPAQDEQFANILTQLDIPHESPEQAATLGNHICRLLAENGAAGPNPVPVVRGVVTTLTNGGLEKGQAVQVMRASAAIYCPQFGSVMGR